MKYSIYLLWLSLFSIGLIASESVYFKTMIKNRSKIHPESYNYAVVRKKSDIKYIKNKKFNPNKSKRVYNYVEINGVKQNIFNRSANNIGLNLNTSRKNKIVNIVKVKNSSLNSNAQLGIKIKTDNRRKKIIIGNSKIVNNVKIKKSFVGNRKERIMYSTYKLFKKDE